MYTPWYTLMPPHPPGVCLPTSLREKVCTMVYASLPASGRRVYHCVYASLPASGRRTVHCVHASLPASGKRTQLCTCLPTSLREKDNEARTIPPGLGRAGQRGAYYTSRVRKMCTTRRVLPATMVRTVHNEARTALLPWWELFTTRRIQLPPWWELFTTRSIYPSHHGENCEQWGAYCSLWMEERKEATYTYPPGYHGGHTIPAYTAYPGSLGGPHHAHGCTGGPAQHRWSAGRTVTSRGALSGRNVWVEPTAVLPVHKGVMVGRQFSRWSCRLSRKNGWTIG